MTKNNLVYTGVGSRQTPQNIIDEMIKIGKTLGEAKWTLRSGGADLAFEQGCDRAAGSKEIFLPSKGFNKNKSPLHNQLPEAFDIASTLHPAWPNLKPFVRKLMARNVHQVLGPNLDSPSEFVICWTPYGEAVGGTALAINLAKREGVPVYNIFDGFALQAFYADLEDFYLSEKE